MRYKLYAINQVISNQSDRSWYYNFRYIHLSTIPDVQELTDLLAQTSFKSQHDSKYDIYVSVVLNINTVYVIIPDSSSFFNLDLIFRSSNERHDSPATPVKQVVSYGQWIPFHSSVLAKLSNLDKIASSVFDVANALATPILRSK